ncbi:LysR family transcriptional regulator [Edaphovirga cremea]|uniref:LysR family transcriptional regulator n=1 Tax=Edaphovirga cremea TaxID=2267246 RepID=UPI000DEFCB82|nr:LysR family transcriptional regulator [Edaphovirga cremea]
MENMDWNDLRFFLGVARTTSLSGASQTLQVSPSTVARRIAALENSLGTHLFVRHATGYFLTDHGRDVLRQAEGIEESMLSLAKGVADLDANVSGIVRLATAETLAVHLIVPALPQLIERYPKLQLEIITGVGMVDLQRYEADLALRLVRPQYGNLVIQKLGTMASAVYGNADYLSRHPATPENPLSDRTFIIWDKAHAHLPTALWLEKHHCDRNPALVTSSVSTQYAAAKAGIGLALLPCFVAVNDRTLIEVIPADKVFSEELWLVTHTDLRASARIRAVVTFLQDILAKASPSFL